MSTQIDKQNVEGHNDKNQIKTYSVYHTEYYRDGYEEYFKGYIEAEDIEEAEDIALKEYLTMNRRDVMIEEFEDESFIEFDTIFYDKNGNEVEQDEENDKQSYVTHSLRIVKEEQEIEEDE